VRFSIPAGVLLPVLAPLAHLASRSSNALPALLGVLVEAKPDKLRLTANNAMTGLSVTLDRPPEVAPYTEGKALIPYTWHDLLRNVDGPVEVSGEDDVIVVTYPGGHARLGGIPADSFVMPPVAKTSFELGTADLKAGLARVGFATAKKLEDQNPLDHVELVIQGGAVRWAATNRYQGAVFTTSASGTTNAQLCVPVDALSLVARLCNAEKVRMGVTSQGFGAVWGTTRLYSRVNTTPFPPFVEYLPTDLPTKAKVEVARLRDALARVSTTAEDRLRVRVEDGCVVLAAAYASGESEERLPATVEGDEVEMLFNPPLLADALAHAPAPEVTLEIAQHDRPLLLRADTQGFQFVMPMMDDAVQAGPADDEEAA